MIEHYLAWWNVENLFNAKDDPDRSEKLERTLGKELNGWTASVLNKKLRQISSIIVQMNGGAGPDIITLIRREAESKRNTGAMVDSHSVSTKRPQLTLVSLCDTLNIT